MCQKSACKMGLKFKASSGICMTRKRGLYLQMAMASIWKKLGQLSMFPPQGRSLVERRQTPLPKQRLPNSYYIIDQFVNLTASSLKGNYPLYLSYFGFLFSKLRYIFNPFRQFYVLKKTLQKHFVRQSHFCSSNSHFPESFYFINQHIS